MPGTQEDCDVRPRAGRPDIPLPSIVLQFLILEKPSNCPWANLCARFLTADELRPEHTAQIAFGYDLLTRGFGLHFGVEEVGAKSWDLA